MPGAPNIASIFFRCAFSAFGGFIVLITGHAILRAANLSPYNDSQYSINSSMKAGALGGTLMGFPMYLIEYLLGKIKLPEDPVKKDEETAVGTASETDGAASAKNDSAQATAKNKDDPNFGLANVQLARINPYSNPLLFLLLLIGMASAVAFGAGTGAIGTAILRSAKNDHSFLPPMYAARAGSVAGAVFGPGLITLGVTFTFCCGGMVAGSLILARRGPVKDGANNAAAASNTEDAAKPN